MTRTQGKPEHLELKIQGPIANILGRCIMLRAIPTEIPKFGPVWHGSGSQNLAPYSLI